MSAETAGDVIDDASRDRGLVAGTQQEARVGKVPTCVPALAGTRSGHVPTRAAPRGTTGPPLSTLLHPMRIGGPSFPKTNDGWSGLFFELVFIFFFFPFLSYPTSRTRT